MKSTQLFSSHIPDNNIFKGMIVCKCCKKYNQVKKLIINMNNEKSKTILI